MSGNPGLPPAPSPPRTVRASFPAYGSSLCQGRLHDPVQTFAIITDRQCAFPLKRRLAPTARGWGDENAAENMPTIPPVFVPPNNPRRVGSGSVGGSKPVCRRQSNFSRKGESDNPARSPTRYSPGLFVPSSDARPRGGSEERWVGLRASSTDAGANKPRPDSERRGFAPPPPEQNPA